MQIMANGINIEVEEYGNPQDPVVLLIMGFTAQLVYWPMDLVNALVAKGFRVIRFDNRDVGLSHKFDNARAPGPIRQVLSKKIFPSRRLAPYNLSDMARDAVGILDALNIDKAHIVGASMGGMIAQIFAADFPDRVLSLTPIMSSTNGPGLPAADVKVRSALLRSSRTPAKTQQEALEGGLAFSSLIASEEGRQNPERREAIMQEALDRCFYPAGPRRQMAAIIESGNLRPTARRISAPTLVIHGTDDPLIPHPCGADIAENINDARLELVDGMGHDLPLSKLPVIADMIAAHCKAAA